MHSPLNGNSNNFSQPNILLHATGNPAPGDAGEKSVPALDLIDGFHELAVFIRSKRKTALQNRLGAEGLHQAAEIFQISPVIDESATHGLIEPLHRLDEPLATARQLAFEALLDFRLYTLFDFALAPLLARLPGRRLVVVTFVVFVEFVGFVYRLLLIPFALMLMRILCLFPSSSFPSIV